MPRLYLDTSYKFKKVVRKMTCLEHDKIITNQTD